MTLINSMISWIMKKRMHQIELFVKYPDDIQFEWLLKLITSAQNTEWGKQYDYKTIKSYDEFSRRVPITNYEILEPYVIRLRNGEQNLLWNSKIKWFAKSSGTTNSKSKLIPVSQEALDECHFKGGKDLLTLYCNNNPDTKIFTGKLLGMGGSHFFDSQFNEKNIIGDVSAIIMENLPTWIQIMRTPALSVALMSEWESKIEKIAQITCKEDVTNITGVPSWTLILLRKIIEITGKNNINEVWPKLELFVHGGISFKPYQKQFKELIPNSINYIETYNASEGFFGISDQINSDEMLLMLDYGIFYEFIKAIDLNTPNQIAIPLSEVELGIDYAIIITTNAGLWRYLIGDTIKFTSKNPYKIIITGRTKSFINTFGEELIVDNALKAISLACEKTNAIISNFTAAPIFFDKNQNAAHEWAIEFEKLPNNLESFANTLDCELKNTNSDYEAKRYKDLILKKPIINVINNGTFYNWLKQNNRLGGQFKVPNLSNDRKYLNEIIEISKQLKTT